MRKNHLALSRVAALSLVVSLACLSGCGKKPGATEKVPVDYKPLFPAGSSVIAYHDIAAARTNAIALQLNAAVTDKLAQVFSLWQGKVPGTGPASFDLQGECDESERKLFEKTGLTEKDFNWMALSMGEIRIPTNILIQGIDFPDVAAVLYSAKPIDPVAFADVFRDLLRDSLREKWGEADGEGLDERLFEQRLDELRGLFALEESRWKGRPAMKLVFKAPEVTNLVRRLSPVLAPIGDGRLLALAGSEETLERLDSLYAGTERPQPATAVVAAAIDRTGSAYHAFSFTQIDRLVSELLPVPVPASKADIMPYLEGLVGFHGLQGTDGDACFAEYRADFNDPGLASTLASQLLMVKAAAGMVVAMAVPELSLQGVATRFIDKIAVSSEDGQLRLRFTLSPSLVREIDARALLMAYGGGVSLPGEEDGADEDEEGAPGEALEEDLPGKTK